jgi:hypothetical protein
MKKPSVAGILAGLALFVALGGAAAAREPAAPPATSGPRAQGQCAFTFESITTADGYRPISGLTISVDNGNKAHAALVQVSADMGVDADAEVRVAYSVDNGPPREDFYGPGNLANHQQYYEGRAVIAVIPLPAGAHTITPFWRISGAAGKNAFVDSRCMTVQS